MSRRTRQMLGDETLYPLWAAIYSNTKLSSTNCPAPILSPRQKVLANSSLSKGEHSITESRDKMSGDKDSWRRLAHLPNSRLPASVLLQLSSSLAEMIWKLDVESLHDLFRRIQNSLSNLSVGNNLFPRFFPSVMCWRWLRLGSHRVLIHLVCENRPAH